MSQNQSYFWQTTRHNVYLKRSAKLRMLIALMAVLTFSTICVAEIQPSNNEDNDLLMGTKLSFPDGTLTGSEILNGEAIIPPNVDPTQGIPSSKTGFVDAFTASISVILFTELGDKTFFIAAIMAMRHPRLIIFVGAISALALMTVLSVVFGMAATIIPKVYTYYISTALFAIFGLKMIYEGYFMKPTDAQDELEEVQTEMRKREDELMRSKRGKYEDNGNEGKRKNSNSDKEDNSAGTAGTSNGMITLPTTAVVVKNPEMQHRQRKQLNYNSTLNNNNINNINVNVNNNNKNTNNNGCEIINEDDDSIGECRETDVFLESGLRKHETIKMATFHHMNSSQSSPAISSSAISNQTTQTICCDDEFLTNNDSPNKRNFNSSNNNHNHNSNSNDQRDTPKNMLFKKEKRNSKSQIVNGNGPMTMIHSTSATAAISTNSAMNSASLTNINDGIGSLGSKNSLNTASNHSINSAAAASAGLDGSKRRLERNVSATVVQDPESGIVRKTAKKGAAYLTTRVLMQAFTMTFLAEWGDRSQLTTIILAASKNVYGVITGGIIGHSICTGLAVIGGRMVAAKISVRTVTIVGGIVFLCFAIYALIARPDDI